MQRSFRIRSVLGVLLVGAIVPSCKEVGSEQEGNEPEVVAGRRSQMPGYFASDAVYLQKNANFFFRVWDETFTRKFDDLPDLGEVPEERRPYTGGYYAEGDGGTNQVMAGGKSPLQKYDEAFHGGQNKATAWEREKHTTGPEWAGHCNGFSATAQRHPREPAQSVVRNGVTFAPQDIKALLAEIHMNADYEFLGGNRCELDRNFPTPDGRDDPTVMGECEDINPGTLHAAIGNWLGRMKHTLIMDQFAGDQVWNYPLWRYQVLSKEDVSEADARQYVSGTGTEYIFNPSAVRFVLVRTRLTYTEATRREVLGQYSSKSQDLTYILELNAAGEILGGEWASPESRAHHPDFLWVALEPLEPNGTRYMGNPHVDADEVIRLWAESAGYDPDRAPRDITRPPGSDDWGRWPSFEVVLDGSATGAVFAGKKVTLRVKRRESLQGAGVVLDVAVNGEQLKSVTTRDNADIAIAFDPGPGLSRFKFTWKRDDAIVEEQYLRYHVVR